MLPSINYSLQLITPCHLKDPDALEKLVVQAIKGGVTLVQLRNKLINTRELLALGQRLKVVLQFYHIPLVINDRVDIALALAADGVHLGQDDLPYPIARQLLGKNKIIGLSINTLAQLEQANQWDVNYLGVGPIFPTTNKTDAQPLLGVSLLKTMRSISKHPLIAIGGINQNHLTEIINTGIDGIAVIAAISDQPDPEQSARQLAHGLQQHATL